MVVALIGCHHSLAVLEWKDQYPSRRSLRLKGRMLGKVGERQLGQWRESRAGGQQPEKKEQSCGMGRGGLWCLSYKRFPEGMRLQSGKRWRGLRVAQHSEEARHIILELT